MSSSTADVAALRSGHRRPAHIASTAAIALVLHAPSLVRKRALNADEATIAVVARSMRHGSRLYRDIVDRKPPAAFVLDRLLEPVFGGWTLTAARWVALALTVVAAWVLAGEVHRRRPEVPPVAVAALFVVAFALLPPEDSRAFGFEWLGVLPAVAAFVLGARGRVVPAALTLGVAALCKQPYVLGCLPLAWQLARHPGSLARRAARVAVAGVVSAATIIAGLAPFGLGDALHWFSGRGDNYLGGTDLGTVVVVTAEQFAAFAGLTGGVILLAVLAWRRQRRDADMVVWAVSALAATAIGLRFILHYFDQLLPPLVALAAPALAVRAPRARIAAATMLTGAATWTMITAITPTLVHDLPEVDGVSAAVRARTEPGDSIFVWGQAPEIYWLSGRDPATRYPHVGFVTGVTPRRPGTDPYELVRPESTAALLADLRAHPPALVVDAAVEGVRGGERYPLATSPIAAFVAEDYCAAAVVDGMTLFSPCSPDDAS
jgi:hypothetical protein